MCSSLLDNRRVVRRQNRRGTQRAGVATVELSVVLPLLVFLFVVGMDYSRVFYAAVVVTNCARNGALYASDPNVADASAYDTLQQAVEADASDLPEPLTVDERQGIDNSGYDFVEVTVTYPFKTVLNYPGIPSTIAITKTTHMRKVPSEENP